MIDRERRQQFLRMARRLGFDIDEPFADDEEMRIGIREIALLDPGAQPTDLQRRALLQNLRQVILRTACAVYPDPSASLARQSQLRRWHHLRAIEPAAADVFLEVLRYFGVTPPSCLLPEAGND